MLNKYILENPEFIRHCRTSFRYPRIIGSISLYLITIISIYVLVYFLFSLKNFSGEFDFKTLSKILYVITLGMEYIIFFYVGTYLTTNSLGQEREKGTFDFIRLSSIDKKVIAIGKLLGAPVFITILILITFPFVSIFAYIAEIPLIHFITVHYNLIIYGLLFHTLGLFCAINLSKSATANSLAISIPLLYSFVSLSFEVRTANPFYSLFILLENKPFLLKEAGFYIINLPDFVLVSIFIFFFTFWAMVGLIRKLKSEFNHTLTKKQTLYFVLTFNILFVGISWERFASGEIILFFIVNFIIISILIAIINPTREDVLIYFNRKMDLKSKIWSSKSPSFYLVFILNIFILLTASLSIVYQIITDFVTKELLLTVLISTFVLFIFTFIYSQVFYLMSLVFSKNSSVIAMIIILISLFIPIPLNLLTQTKKEFIDLFLLNPFISFIKFSEKDLFNLSTITQIMTLLIILLFLNVMILTKQEELHKKFKL